VEPYNGLMTPKYPDADINSRVAGDKRSLLYNRGTLQPFVCDLSSAQAMKEFPWKGDVLYVDKLSTGTVKFRFDTSWQRGFPLGANSAVRGFPFESLLLEWDAQPGKSLVIWYGYGLEIVPPNQDITSIGTVDAVTEITNTVITQNYGDEYGTSYVSAAGLTANTPSNVWSAATNAAGVRLISAALGVGHITTTSVAGAFLHKATAPANVADGDASFVTGAMRVNQGGSNYYTAAGKLHRPLIIPTGLRGDFISTTTTSFVQMRQALYTVL
jgi:hypothetical protein